MLFNYVIKVASLIITNTSLRFYKSNWYFWLRSLFRKVKKKLSLLFSLLFDLIISDLFNDAFVELNFLLRYSIVKSNVINFLI